MTDAELEAKRRNHYLLFLFVPRDLIQQALCDMQHVWAGGFSWIKCADYLKDDDCFAVQVQMTDHFPFLINEWTKKWGMKKSAQISQRTKSLHKTVTTAQKTKARE